MLLRVASADSDVAVGDSWGVLGCSAEVLGCFSDAGYALGLRSLPYNVPGCYPGTGQPTPPTCKGSEALQPPACSQAEMSNAYCAQRCVEWAPRIPGAGSGEVYAATQNGFACFCGTAAEGAGASASANHLPFTDCDVGCGPQPSAGGTPRPVGSGERCGGNSKNLVMRIDCSSWGRDFLLLLLLGGGGYVLGGVALGARAGGGGRGWALQSHPHWPRWKALDGLVRDGVAVARGGRGGRGAAGAGREPPLVARAEDGRQARSDKGRKERGGKRCASKGGRRLRRRSGSNGLGDEAGDLTTPSPTANTEAGGAGGVADGGKGTKAGDGGRWVHVPG